MIPFLDLKAQYQSIKSEIDTAVLGVLASGQYILGEEVARLEQEFADYCDVKHGGKSKKAETTKPDAGRNRSACLQLAADQRKPVSFRTIT